MKKPNVFRSLVARAANGEMLPWNYKALQHDIYVHYRNGAIDENEKRIITNIADRFWETSVYYDPKAIAE